MKKKPTPKKEGFEYPIISGRNIFVLDYINALMDHHIIKREIKKAQFQEDSEEEEGGSIFDDFFGGSSSKPKKEKKEEVKQLEIDHETLLSIVSDYYSGKGFGILGLILAYENKDTQMIQGSADNLVKNIIIEVVKGSGSDNSDSSDRVTKAIDELVSRFKLLDKEEYFYFVRNQYRFLDNLRLEFRFIKSDKNSSVLMFRLEEELLKSLDFISIITSYPFAIDLEDDEQSLKNILSFIEYLENVVE